MNPKIAVAISGGVDSLMAAHLLKEQGQEVIGIHFITGFETAASFLPHPSRDPQHPVADIGTQLGIDVKIIDIRSEFQEKIINYFTRTYQAGQTPNPCMRCNPVIKFGTILSFARQLGADRLATGHYARIKKDADNGLHLLKGRDAEKDQSYFLARLTPAQLADACFPLGELTKSGIKKLARQKDLHPVTREESQDVCFIKNTSYGQFLAGQDGFSPRPGPIETLDGQVIGEHGGLHLFTVGQRRGINCPAAEPYYVLRLDSGRNCLVVGAKKDLLASECTVKDINWIQPPPTAPIEVRTRVRYRSQEVISTLFPLSDHTATVRFKTPLSAITPGQAAVFYQGDEVLGGGWIENSS
jgi:tRNA-specific 2-thiouridylase